MTRRIEVIANGLPRWGGAWRSAAGRRSRPCFCHRRERCCTPTPAAVPWGCTSHPTECERTHLPRAVALPPVPAVCTRHRSRRTVRNQLSNWRLAIDKWRRCMPAVNSGEMIVAQTCDNPRKHTKTNTFFFFFSGLFPQHPRGSLCTALGPQTAAGIASASDSTHGEAAVGRQSPASLRRRGALHSPPGGSSRRDAAKARCAATARMPLHLTTHAARAAVRREAGTSPARSRQQADAASGAHLPPSIPNTSEHHLAAAARPLQLGISLALFAACSLGKNDAGAGWPSRPRGLTSVASTASCSPCHRGSPLQTTSIRRASCMGTSRFMSASRTFLATRAPASRHTPARTRSRGMAREARTLL